MSSNLSAEVAIVGAGLVGLAAAVAFAQQDKSVVLLDAKKPQVKSVVKLKKAWDERVYALTPESESWLKSIGVWAFVDVSRVSPIHAMHIVDDVNEQNLILRAEDANLPKLGVIVENQNLIHALNQQISALDVTVITEATCQTLNNSQQDIVLGLEDGRQVAAKLMVAADGVNSWVRNPAFGIRQLTSVDLPMPDCPSSRVVRPASQGASRATVPCGSVLALHSKTS